MSVIYENGTILTMDENCPKVEAVMIDQGKFLKCGTREEVLACKKQDTQVVDLQGKTMMPGFIDGHSHFSGLATSLSQCDLSEAKDFTEIVCKMKEFIEKNGIPKGQWVVGTNYDHNFLNERKHPDKKVLDEISQEHPIVVVHASSHMGQRIPWDLQSRGLRRKQKTRRGDSMEGKQMEKN